MGFDYMDFITIILLIYIYTRIKKMRSKSFNIFYIVLVIAVGIGYYIKYEISALSNEMKTYHSGYIINCDSYFFIKDECKKFNSESNKQ